MRDVDPRAALEGRLPEMEDDVICLDCGHRWVCVRTIGADLGRAECPFCRRRAAAFEHFTDEPSFTAH